MKVLTCGEKLKIARNTRHWTQGILARAIAEQLGTSWETERVKLSMYERGVIEPTREKVAFRQWMQAAAKALETDFEWFFDGKDSVMPRRSLTASSLMVQEGSMPYGKVEVPVLGEVTAGPFTSASSAIGTEPFDKGLVDSAPDAFALVVVDESMLPTLHPGDVILVKPVKAARHNVITVAEDQDHNTTVKVAKARSDGRHDLFAKNPPEFQVKAEEIKILGIVIGIRRRTGGQAYMEMGDPTGVRA